MSMHKPEGGMLVVDMSQDAGSEVGASHVQCNQQYITLLIGATMSVSPDFFLHHA